MSESIFNDGELLRSDKHAALRFRPDAGYAPFAREMTAPLTLAEFSASVGVFPILFAHGPEGPAPVALMGLSRGENLFVTEDGSWTARYIPGHFRQLPFFNTEVRDTGKVVLSILPEHDAFSGGADSVPLFESDGAPSAFLANVMMFTRQQYDHARTTRVFCNLLVELELLTLVTGRVEVPGQGARRLRGFAMVDRKKLKALPDTRLAELERSGALEAIHLHWASIRNLEGLAARIAQERGGVPIASPLTSVSSIAHQLSAPLH